MGLLDTLKRALGLDRAPPPARTDGVWLTDDAHRHLAGLPEGRAVRVDTLPADGGWLVQVTELASTGPFHPAFEGAPVLASDEVVARLAGLELHHTVGRWQVRADVAVRARETPNPDSRHYLVDRPLSDGRLTFYADATPKPRLAAALLSRGDVRAVTVRADTLTVERAPSAPWDAIDQAVATAVREHVLLCGGVLTGAARPRGDDPLHAAVQELLDTRVRPALHRDGGDLELVGVEDGVVRVHLVGACRSCPASTLTLEHAVTRALLDAFPGEIDRVESV